MNKTVCVTKCISKGEMIAVTIRSLEELGVALNYKAEVDVSTCLLQSVLML